MSFRERVERITDNHHVLPRTGAMRVDVHAYLSPALLTQTDEALWRQAAQAAAYPGMAALYLMPDTHLGYGIPVGGVAVTEDVLIQLAMKWGGTPEMKEFLPDRIPIRYKLLYGETWWPIGKFFVRI